MIPAISGPPAMREVGGPSFPRGDHVWFEDANAL